ncbi:MAG: leader peptidase (prepilin peptidase) / N-methyltransferase [Solirubrobacteraceae bacterium]|nr:leader peptidase (prepilin peptidase) / N-methyltransferase [Solirubrobacteraceae bacterium]
MSTAPLDTVPTAPRVRLTDSRAFSPAVAAATLLVAGAAALTQGSLALAVLRGVLVVVLVPCAVIDIERRIIPNRITYPATLIAVLLGLALDAGHEPRRLMWAGVAGGFLLLTALVNPAGMGMGDVKLLAVMGLFLGRPVVIALFLALLGPVVVGVVRARRQGVRAARKSALPFGPYLALGGLIAIVAGDPILHAYLTLHH